MTTQDFNSASAHLKAAMVVMKYISVGENAEKLRIELCTLNNWLAELPALMEQGKCTVPDLYILRKVAHLMEGNQDGLTSEFVRHAQLVQTLLKYILQK